MIRAGRPRPYIHMCLKLIFMGGLKSLYIFRRPLEPSIRTSCPSGIHVALQTSMTVVIAQKNPFFEVKTGQQRQIMKQLCWV
jgi:hypothetical protein